MGRFNVIRVEREGDVALSFQLARRAVFASDPTAPVPKDEAGNPTVVVDEKGHAVLLVSPPGQPFTLRVELAELDAATLAQLAALEAKRVELYDVLAEQAFTAFEKKPEALERKIADADFARRELERTTAMLEATRKELAATEAKRAELAAAAVPPAPETKPFDVGDADAAAPEPAAAAATTKG